MSFSLGNLRIQQVGLTTKQAAFKSELIDFCERVARTLNREEARGITEDECQAILEVETKVLTVGAVFRFFFPDKE